MNFSVRLVIGSALALSLTGALSGQLLDGDLVAVNYDSPLLLESLDVSGERPLLQDTTALEFGSPRSVGPRVGHRF